MSTLLSLSSSEQFLRLVNLRNNTKFTLRHVSIGLPVPVTGASYNTRVTLSPKYNSGVEGPVVINYNRLLLSGFTRYGVAKLSLSENPKTEDIITAFNAKYKSNLSSFDDIGSFPVIPTLLYFPTNYSLTANPYSLAYYGSIELTLTKAQGSTIAGSLTTGVNSPAVIHSHAAGIIGDFLYIVGGNTGSSNVNAVRAYNLITKSWSSKATGPSARSGASYAVLDGILYVSCGKDQKDLWAYNPANNTWTRKADLPGGKQRTYGAMTSANGKLYLHGGVRSKTNLADMFVYTPSNNSWAELAVSPTARQKHSLIGVDGKLFLIGGGIENNNTFTAVPEVYCYDIATASWTTVASMMNSQLQATAVELNGYIYVYGGETSSPTNILQRYDIVSNTWAIVGIIGQSRSKHVMAKYNNKLIVHGGTLPAVTNTLFELS